MKKPSLPLLLALALTWLAFSPRPSIAPSPPVFTNYSRSPVSAAPGQTIAFDVSASDPQDSALTFAWTANLGSLGTPVNGATSSHVSWRAPSCVSGGATPTLIVTVTDALTLKATKSFGVTGLPACSAAGWSSAASMPLARTQHTATLLPNGTVLVVGGLDNYGNTLATAAIYDPGSNTWSTAAAMASARTQHTATLLPNGTVLIAGGRDDYGNILATTTAYDPNSHVWSTGAAMASARTQHAATLLPNGTVLLVGGLDAWENTLATAAVYDPDSHVWSAASSMPLARTQHTATLLPNWTVLVVGGLDSYGNTLATAAVYSP